jgi:tetratricopeptide (TPR) repeat protein
MGGSKRSVPGEKNGPEVKTPPAPAQRPDPGPVVPPGFTAVWHELRSGLRQVHRVMACALREDRDGEHEALLAVAQAPAFAAFGPRDDCTGTERGRWLTDRVVRGVQQARDTAPAVVPGGLGGAAGQALVFWCLHVALGIPVDELGAAQEGDIEPPLRGRDLAQKIEGRMWLSARPTGRAAPGVVTLHHEVQAALRDRFPAREDGDDDLARANFAYEWRRLAGLGRQPERDLLTLLSTLAPDPLPVSFLAEAWGPLPEPLRDLGTSTYLMALALRRLLDRGLLLVTSREDGTRLVGIPRPLHPLPAGTLDTAQRRRWADIALRFLGVALRGDTHDHDSWPEWRDALPHVRHLVALAEEHGEGLPEAADLMDRLSVFHRVRGEDAEALETARRALRLYERAGNPAPVKQATYLTNYAMAVRMAEGPAAALEPVERALALEADRTDADHAQTLNLYASILESAGRTRQAEEAFQQSLAMARRTYADSGSEEDAEALTMVLNDYSVHLLSHAPEQGPSARAVAEEVLRMLDEAERASSPGGYGTEQILLNRAGALRRLGRLDDAREALERLVALCEEWDEPTLLLFAALVDLSEVLDDLGDPRHTEVLRRAHQIDDLLAAAQSA